MKSKFFAVATFAFAFAFALSAGAVYQSDIYTASSGYLMVGSGYGAKAYQNANVIAAQTALNACVPGMDLVKDGKFGVLTKAKFVSFQMSKNIKPDGIIGPVTAGQLAACSGSATPTTPTTSTTLEGGAGDVTLTNTTTSTVDTLKEGESNIKVMAFKAEADGSDLAITSLKLSLWNDDTQVSSDRIEKYLDSVTVYAGTTKVGSADAADFTRDSNASDDSTDLYTKTIALSNAVVKDGKTVTFYVAVSAVDSIDTDNQDAQWNLELSTARFNDATGAILTADVSPVDVQNFGFDAASADDTLSVTASTANPQAANLTVKESSLSDSYLVSAFKLKTGTDAGDIMINEIPVTLTLNDSANTASSDTPEAIVDSVTLKIDGTTYESDSNTDAVTNGDGTSVYSFIFDAGDVTLSGDSSTEVKVYVKFNDQDNNYGSGTTIVSDVDGADIDAESANGDVVTVTGSTTSKTHSLSINAPTFSIVGSPTLVSFFHDDTASDVYLAKFVFNVTAGDDDIYVSSDAADINYTQLGTGDVNSVTLDAEDGSLDDNSLDYLVTAGSTEKFTLSFYVEGNSVSDKITIDDFTYGLTDGAGDKTVSTGLSSFHTPTVYLAE